jgi:hypothetical protein
MGMWTSPYYDKETGEHLGNDENGFSGDIMVTTKEAYKKANKNEDGSVSSKSIQADKETHGVQDGEELKAMVYSNIYTDILRQGGYDVSKMAGSAIAIKTSSDSYNNPSPNVRNQLTSGVGEPEFKISVNQAGTDAKIELTTVENVQNSLGAHEYMGHGISGFMTSNKTHFNAYENQMNDATWSGTTKRFKQRMVARYADLLQRENPSRYRQKYPEIIKYWE